MSPCRMADGNNTTQIKGKFFCQHTQMINSRSDVLERAWPSTSRVVDPAVFYIPTCYAEARQSRRKRRGVRKVRDEVAKFGFPAAPMNDHGNGNRCCAFRQPQVAELKRITAVLNSLARRCGEAVYLYRTEKLSRATEWITVSTTTSGAHFNDLIRTPLRIRGCVVDEPQL